MSLPPLFTSARKSRQGGRILPRHARGKRPLPLAWRLDTVCAVCGARRCYAEANGRTFCYVHSPGRALVLMGLADGAPIIHSSAAIPSRRTLEKILRLAGYTEAAPKPPRPKKRPRDRRYVR